MHALPDRVKSAIAHLQSVTGRTDLCAIILDHIISQERELERYREQEQPPQPQKVPLFIRFWEWLNSPKGGH